MNPPHLRAVLRVATVIVTFLIGTSCHADGVSLRILSVPPMRGAMSVLLAQYQKDTGNKVTIDYFTPGPMMERVQRGEEVDILIVAKDLSTTLQNQGKTAASTETDLAKVGMGVFVRRGELKPDVTSVDNFKRTLLAAKSIAYIDPASGAPGGIYLSSLFDKLGIGSDLKPKTKLLGPSGAEKAVAAGEVELGLSQITVILAEPGIELIGPLPAEVQNYLQFTASVAMNSKQPEAGRALLRYLSAPEARAAMREKGYE